MAMENFTLDLIIEVVNLLTWLKVPPNVLAKLAGATNKNGIPVYIVCICPRYMNQRMYSATRDCRQRKVFHLLGKKRTRDP